MSDHTYTVSRDELERLRRQLGDLKRSPELKHPTTLIESMDRLTEALSKFTGLLESANRELAQENVDSYKEDQRKLDKLLEQNEKLARAIVALADVVKQPKQPVVPATQQQDVLVHSEVPRYPPSLPPQPVSQPSFSPPREYTKPVDQPAFEPAPAWQPREVRAAVSPKVDEVLTTPLLPPTLPVQSVVQPPPVPKTPLPTLPPAPVLPPLAAPEPPKRDSQEWNPPQVTNPSFRSRPDQVTVTEPSFVNAPRSATPVSYVPPQVREQGSFMQQSVSDVSPPIMNVDALGRVPPPPPPPNPKRGLLNRFSFS